VGHGFTGSGRVEFAPWFRLTPLPAAPNPENS